MLIDTHSHLVDTQFDADREKVLQRMANEGVRAITCGVDYESSQASVHLAENNEHIYASVGLDPFGLENNVEEFNPSKYEELAKNNKVVAIGEIGIDYYHFDINTQQHKLLISQLLLANKMDLPVILHCRGSKDMPEKAFDDLILILQQNNVHHKGVVHSFTGTVEYAHTLIDMGYFLGFNGIATFDKTGVSEAVLKSIPYDKILIETDSPYLAPVPLRGKRNEPAYIKHVAQYIASILNKDYLDVVKQTAINAKQLFRIPS